MERIKEFLNRQAGPLPIWGWVLVLAVGLGIAVYIRRASPTDVRDEIQTDTGVPGGVANGPGTPGFIQVPPSQPQPDEDMTNEQWRVKAIAYLVGQGTNAVTASNAISRYLNQEKLAGEDVGLIDKVIRGIGPPPTPPDTVPIAPPPTSNTPFPRDDRPATRKNKPAFNDGVAKASRNYESWEEYLVTHYDNVAPRDQRRQIQILWLRTLNVKVGGSIRKGETVRLPKLIYPSARPPGG